MRKGDLIVEVRRYWERKRGDRPMPARADIEPSELKAILPNLALADVAYDPLDFRYRLIGSEIDRHSADSHTGKWVSEIPGRAPPSAVWENLVGVVTSKTPSERSVPYVGPFKDFVTTRQIILPLSDDGTTVNMLMGAIDYVRRADDVAAE